jgi:hypothetical protein
MQRVVHIFALRVMHDKRVRDPVGLEQTKDRGNQVGTRIDKFGNKFLKLCFCLGMKSGRIVFIIGWCDDFCDEGESVDGNFKLQLKAFQVAYPFGHLGYLDGQDQPAKTW